MTRPGRILIVDDIEKWRKTVGSVLRRAGFDVTAAASVKQAREYLLNGLFHLVVLDIQMDTSDENDEQGMDLLKDLEKLNLTDCIQVIMLSNWGTLRRVRDAFSQYSVIDFVPKDEFKGSAFLNRVRQVFDEVAEINLSLQIRWPIGSWDQAALSIKLDGKRVKKETSQQHQIAEELEDLFCRLFYKAESIVARPVTRGQSGTGVLMIEPFYGTGAAQSRIVKYGEVQGIYAEYGNFEKYVKDFVGGGRSTVIHGLRRTPKLAGIMYSFLGTANEQVESFGEYYSHATIADLQEVLNRLFFVTCGFWYSNPGQLKAFDLSEHYQQRMGFTSENLDSALREKLKANLGKHDTFSFTSLGDRTFTNPIPLVAERRFIRTSYECVTHGDLNASNIFVDTDKHAWLIDFGCTGPGHILRDVAELEAMIRFQLLSGESATLEERIRLEEVLADTDINGPADSIPDFIAKNELVAKALTISLHLRSIAAKLISPHRDADFSEYQIALFYYALNTIRFYALETVQRQHAFLCASLLADRIEP